MSSFHSFSRPQSLVFIEPEGEEEEEQSIDIVSAVQENEPKPQETKESKTIEQEQSYSSEEAPLEMQTKDFWWKAGDVTKRIITSMWQLHTKFGMDEIPIADIHNYMVVHDLYQTKKKSMSYIGQLLATNVSQNGSQSPFVRLKRGTYALRRKPVVRKDSLVVQQHNQAQAAAGLYKDPNNVNCEVILDEEDLETMQDTAHQEHPNSDKPQPALTNPNVLKTENAVDTSKEASTTEKAVTKKSSDDDTLQLLIHQYLERSDEEKPDPNDPAYRPSGSSGRRAAAQQNTQTGTQKHVPNQKTPLSSPTKATPASVSAPVPLLAAQNIIQQKSSDKMDTNVRVVGSLSDNKSAASNSAQTVAAEKQTHAVPTKRHANTQVLADLITRVMRQEIQGNNNTITGLRIHDLVGSQYLRSYKLRQVRDLLLAEARKPNANIVRVRKDLYTLADVVGDRLQEIIRQHNEDKQKDNASDDEQSPAEPKPNKRKRSQNTTTTQTRQPRTSATEEQQQDEESEAENDESDDGRKQTRYFDTPEVGDRTKRPAGFRKLEEDKQQMFDDAVAILIENFTGHKEMTVAQIWSKLSAKDNKYRDIVDGIGLLRKLLHSETSKEDCVIERSGVGSYCVRQADFTLPSSRHSGLGRPRKEPLVQNLADPRFIQRKQTTEGNPPSALPQPQVPKTETTSKPSSGLSGTLPVAPQTYASQPQAQAANKPTFGVSSASSVPQTHVPQQPNASNKLTFGVNYITNATVHNGPTLSNAGVRNNVHDTSTSSVNTLMEARHTFSFQPHAFEPSRIGTAHTSVLENSFNNINNNNNNNSNAITNSANILPPMNLDSPSKQNLMPSTTQHGITQLVNGSQQAPIYLDSEEESDLGYEMLDEQIDYDDAPYDSPAPARKRQKLSSNTNEKLSHTNEQHFKNNAPAANQQNTSASAQFPQVAGSDLIVLINEKRVAGLDRVSVSQLQQAIAADSRYGYWIAWPQMREVLDSLVQNKLVTEPVANHFSLVLGAPAVAAVLAQNNNGNQVHHKPTSWYRYIKTQSNSAEKKDKREVGGPRMRKSRTLMSAIFTVLTDAKAKGVDSMSVGDILTCVLQNDLYEFGGRTPLHSVTARLVAELSRPDPLVVRVRPSTYALSDAGTRMTNIDVTSPTREGAHAEHQ